MKEYKARIAVLSVFVILSSLSFLVIPYFLRFLVDGAFLGRDMGKFVLFFSGSLGLFLWGMLLKVSGDMLRNRIYTGMRSALGQRFAEKLYSFDMAYFENTSPGENSFRFSDIAVLPDFVCEQAPAILAESFKLIAITFVCLYLDAGMAVLLAGSLLLLVLQGALIRRKTNDVYQQFWGKNASLAAEFAESLSRMRVIKALHLEPYRMDRFLGFLRESIFSERKSMRWNLFVSAAASLWTGAVGAVIALYGGLRVVRGGLTFGEYTVIMAYAALAAGSLNSLAERLLSSGRSLVFMRNVLFVLDADISGPASAAAGRLSSAKGEFCFTDVSFGYSKDYPVLKRLNLRIPPASFTAFAGPSGCGKTTIINLLLRLYAPLWEGAITLDGLNLEDIHPYDLRSVISLSTQQPALFNASIAENISCILGQVNEEAVFSSARTAALHEYILSLPRGYETMIGDDGCRLSQGIKQRIAIARAVYRKPSILILDEATSSIDTRTEEKIFAALREERQGLSTLVVSHRLSSIRGAERIFFIKDGCLAAEGAHEKMLLNERAYAEFFHYQLMKENYETK
jgi:ABC-type multidrug transport system fused ATPase/permease subunit